MNGFCPDHFDMPHRYPSGVPSDFDGTGTLAVPLIGRTYTVFTRECTRCDLKMFACDCQTGLHWLDWPDPVRKCNKCGREWWLTTYPVRTAEPKRAEPSAEPADPLVLDMIHGLLDGSMKPVWTRPDDDAETPKDDGRLKATVGMLRVGPAVMVHALYAPPQLELKL